MSSIQLSNYNEMKCPDAGLYMLLSTVISSLIVYVSINLSKSILNPRI